MMVSSFKITEDVLGVNIALLRVPTAQEISTARSKKKKSIIAKICHPTGVFGDNGLFRPEPTASLKSAPSVFIGLTRD
jgi:hypothetical protein